MNAYEDGRLVETVDFPFPGIDDAEEYAARLEIEAEQIGRRYAVKLFIFVMKGRNTAHQLLRLEVIGAEFLGAPVSVTAMARRLGVTPRRLQQLRRELRDFASSTL